LVFFSLQLDLSGVPLPVCGAVEVVSYFPQISPSPSFQSLQLQRSPPPRLHPFPVRFSCWGPAQREILGPHFLHGDQPALLLKSFLLLCSLYLTSEATLDDGFLLSDLLVPAPVSLRRHSFFLLPNPFDFAEFFFPASYLLLRSPTASMGTPGVRLFF